jgi:hypothetical protein
MRRGICGLLRETLKIARQRPGVCPPTLGCESQGFAPARASSIPARTGACTDSNVAFSHSAARDLAEPIAFEPVSAETQPISGRLPIQISDIEKSSSRDSPRDSRSSARIPQNCSPETGLLAVNARKSRYFLEYPKFDDRGHHENGVATALGARLLRRRGA